MTREEYLNYKQSGPAINIFYEYWIEVKKPHYTVVTPQEFQLKFLEFISVYLGVPIACPDTTVKMCTLEQMQDKVLGYFDAKFGL